MSLPRKHALDSYRGRQRRRGLRRLVLQAREADVPLLREFARVLREDSLEASELRRVLRRVLAPETPEGTLKQLLEAAPLEGIELSRPRDFGRGFEL